MAGQGSALVTGASARIGLAIAERLLAAGYRVVLHASARSHQRAEAEARRLRANGGMVSVVAADLTDATTLRGVVDAAAANGSLDLLVNNAALFEPDRLGSLDVVLWDKQFAVNLRAPVLLAEAFAASSDETAGSPPADRAIVNIIDQRVLRPTPEPFSYTLAKASLWTATRMLAAALAPKGIRVNAVGPGPVLPNVSEGDAAFRDEVAALPLPRALDPGDVAAAVLYLAAARGVTGQFIAVDAGQHLAGAVSRSRDEDR